MKEVIDAPHSWTQITAFSFSFHCAVPSYSQGILGIMLKIKFLGDDEHFEMSRRTGRKYPLWNTPLGNKIWRACKTARTAKLFPNQENERGMDAIVTVDFWEQCFRLFEHTYIFERDCLRMRGELRKHVRQAYVFLLPSIFCFCSGL